LVVIAIIGLLIGLLMPALSGARESAHINTCKNNLSQSSKAVIAYDVSRGRMPKYWDDGVITHQGSTGVKGNWFVQALPFMDAAGVHEEVSAGGSGYKLIEVSPKVPPSSDYQAGQKEGYEPATKTVDDPACIAQRVKVYDPIPDNGGIQRIPGYEYEFPAPAQTYRWVPPTCPKVTIPNPKYPKYTPGRPQTGTPGRPAVTKIVYLGLDAITGTVWTSLICPSDPTTADGYVAQWPAKWSPATWKQNLPYAVSNYHANWHAFSGVPGDARPEEMPNNPKDYDPLTAANKKRAMPKYLYQGPNVPPSSLARLSDGSSNTILFAEAYGKCSIGKLTYNRFAVWGESFRNTAQNKVDYAYPATNFGTSWTVYEGLGPDQKYASGNSGNANNYTNANTWMFQTTPRVDRCLPVRVQSIHAVGMNVAMADGSVRTLSPDISHQDQSNLLTEPDPAKWTGPVPVDMIAAKVDANGNPLQVMDYGVWDLLMLPKDGLTIDEGN